MSWIACSPVRLPVLLSGYLTVATTVRAIQGGASDVLEKPVSASELDRRLRRLLEARDTSPSLPPSGLNSELRKVLGETAGMRAAREQMLTAARYPELCLTIVGRKRNRQGASRRSHSFIGRFAGPLLAGQPGCCARSHDGGRTLRQ